MQSFLWTDMLMVFDSVRCCVSTIFIGNENDVIKVYVNQMKYHDQ